MGKRIGRIKQILDGFLLRVLLKKPVRYPFNPYNPFSYCVTFLFHIKKQDSQANTPSVFCIEKARFSMKVGLSFANALTFVVEIYF